MASLVSRISDLATAVSTALKSQRGIQAFCSGKPGASEMIGGMIAPYGFTITSARCSAVARVAAAASTVLTIVHDGTTLGTITFSAGATAGVFSFTTTTIVINKLVTITAPSTQDSGLADISILIRP